MSHQTTSSSSKREVTRNGEIFEKNTRKENRLSYTQLSLEYNLTVARIGNIVRDEKKRRGWKGV
ncbi:MAG TPA: hypothetical protein VD999_05610 [Vitreimonas sp.]|nr:hypothetical protein [Vitreimonas sp.]